jgi:2'-5' RNA ligase
MRILFEKIDSDQPTSMIAAYPDKRSIDKILKFRKSLKIPKGAKVLSPDEMHCTIRWWKGERHLDEIIPFLNSLELGKFKCKAVGLERLGDALVVMLDSKELGKAYKKIDKGIQKCGAPPSDYPKFKAHISLYYSENEKLPDDIEIPFGSLTFDKIRFVNQDDEIFWDHMI